MHTDACQVNQADATWAHCSMFGHLLVLRLSKHHGRVTLPQEQQTTFFNDCHKKISAECKTINLYSVFVYLIFLGALRTCQRSINCCKRFDRRHRGSYLIHKAVLSFCWQRSCSLHQAVINVFISNVSHSAAELFPL